MRNVAPGVLLDLEVVELLSERPDLLAIADAVAATQRTRPVRRSGRLPVRLVAVAAVLGVAVAVALVSPWSGRGGLVDRALAAIGSGEVIHVVETAEVPGASVVDLRTGAESPVERTTEIWFDGARGLLRSVQRIGDTVTIETLETPQGAWTQAGRVYTCAWIAAHPVEATKARVSCDASGKNGTTPRQIPEPRPSLTPALAGFVTGYREALESGEATRDGSGLLDGRRVEWLRFAIAGGASAPGRVERVAVDASTLQPVRVETLVEGKTIDAATISVAETVPPENVSFERPKLVPPGTEPVSGRDTDEHEVSLGQADKALDGRLLGLGDSFEGLPLGDVTVSTIVSGYGPASTREPTRATGAEVVYGGPIDPALAHDYVRLQEALEPLMLYSYRFTFQGQTPHEGSLAIATSDVYDATRPGAPSRPAGTLFAGYLLHNDVYVTIEATSKPLLLEAARTLQEVTGP
jgi:hypothetical protein